MDEVESIFTKHFASNDRKKAMKFLRPQVHKGSHMTTFLVGNNFNYINLYFIMLNTKNSLLLIL